MAESPPHRSYSSDRYIIVVDDDELLLKLYNKFLKVSHIKNFYITDSPEDCLAHYTSLLSKPSAKIIVFVDLHLPNSSGKIIAERIRQLGHESTTLVLSTGDRYTDVVKSYGDYGFDHLLPKPFSFEEFIKIIGYTKLGFT